MSTSDIRFRLSVEGAGQAQTSVEGAAKAFEKLDKASAGVAQQTKLTGHQAAQMSAQLQDLFVQIQAGGAPMTALIQQGSQLSAVFGGTGNALRAVASLITPTVASLGAAAAAAAGIGAAFVSGWRESRALADALALTGRAAGITEGQFNALSKSIGERTKAGVGTARDALQELVASGRLTGQALESTAAAAASLSRVTGESVGDVAKQFVGMVDNVADGARRLNERFNFLTGAQYAHIRALEDANDKQAALAETMRLLEARVNTTLPNLGLLERAWLAVSNAIGQAWDNLKGIGRESDIEGQIRALQNEITVADASRWTRSQVPELRQRLEYLREILRMQQRGAEAAGEEAARNKAAVAVEDLRLRSLSGRAKMAKELADATRLLDTAGADDAMRKQVLDGIRDRYKSIGSEARKAADEQRKLWAELIGVTASYSEDLARVQGLRRAGLVDEERYVALVQALIEKQPAVKKMREEEALAIKVAQANYRALVGMQELRAEGEREIAEWEEQRRKGFAADEAAFASRLQAMTDEEAALALAAAKHISLAQAIALVTLRRLEDAKAAAVNDPERLASLDRQIEAQRKIAEAIGRKEIREANDKAAKDAAQAWDKAADQINQSLTDALMRAFESGGSFFSTLWKGIVNTIKTTVLRPVIQAIASPISGALLGALGATGAAQAAGSAGASGALGAAGGVAGVLGVGGAFGSGVAAGLFGGAGIGGTMAAAGSLLGSGTLAGAAAGTGMAIGAVAPYVLAAYAVYKVFGSGGTPHVGGYAMADPAGRISDITAQQGGRQQAETQAAVGELAKVLAGALNASAAAFGRPGGFSVRSVFESDNDDPSWALLHFLRDGVQQRGSFDALGTLDKDSTRGFEQFTGLAATALRDALVAMDLPTWANDVLAALGDAPAVEQIVAAADGIAKTQQAIDAFGASLRPLGGIFERIGALSSDATAAMATAAGGIEALSAGVSTYFREFYSSAEQSEMTLRAVGQQLDAVGLATPTTREAFRALVEAQDLTSESGRAAFGVLMSVAGAFAEAVAPAQMVADAVDGIADAARRVADAQAGVESALQSIADFGQAIRDQIGDTLGEINDLRGQALQAVSDATDRYQAALGGLSGYVQQLAQQSEQAAQRVDQAAQALQAAQQRVSGAIASIADAVRQQGDRIDTAARAVTAAQDAITQAYVAAGDRVAAAARAIADEVDRRAAAVDAAAGRITAAEGAIAAAQDGITRAYVAAGERVASAARALTAEIDRRAAAVEAARSRITDAYLGAVSANEAAQQRLADLQRQQAGTTDQQVKDLRRFGDGIREFLADLNGTQGTPSAQLAFSRDRFRALAGQAVGGDAAAFEQLTGAARALLDASRAGAVSGAAFDADVALVRDLLSRAERTAAASGPAAVADTTLQERIAQALAEVETTGAEVARLLGVAQAAGAATTAAQVDLLAEYTAAQSALTTAQGEAARLGVAFGGAADALSPLVAEFTAANAALSAAAQAVAAAGAATTLPDADLLAEFTAAQSALTDAQTGWTEAQGALTVAQAEAARLGVSLGTTADSLAPLVAEFTAAGAALAEIAAAVAEAGAAATLPQTDLLQGYRDALAGLTTEQDRLADMLSRVADAGVDLDAVDLPDQFAQLLSAYTDATAVLSEAQAASTQAVADAAAATAAYELAAAAAQSLGANVGAISAGLADYTAAIATAQTELAAAQTTAATVNASAYVAQAGIAEQYATLQARLTTLNADLVAFEERTAGIDFSGLAVLDPLGGLLQTYADAVGTLLAAMAEQSRLTATDAWVDIGGGLQRWQAPGGAVAVGRIGGGLDQVTLTNAARDNQWTGTAVSEWANSVMADDLQGIYDAAVAAGVSSALLDELTGGRGSAVLAWALARGLPAFAAGGWHAGGLALVGERGPELANLGPSRIWDADQTRRMLGGDAESRDLLRRIEERLAALQDDRRAADAPTIQAAQETAKILRRWDGEGAPVRGADQADPVWTTAA